MAPQSYSTNPELLSKLCRCDGTNSDWQAFYRQYQDLIAKWCLRFGVSSNDLEDVFHDILLKLVDSLPTYDAASGHKFRSWLKTIVLHALIDRLRVAKNSPFPSLLSDIGAIPSPDGPASTDIEAVQELAEQLSQQTTPAARILLASRSRVTEPTWDAFLRREVLNESAASIAESMGIKKASVYQSVSRVRAIIREESRRYFGSASLKS